MMMNKKLLAISLGLLFGSSQAVALDLLHAYDAALSNDPAFKAAVKENEAGQANRVIGRSGLMPKVAVTYNQFMNNSAISGPVVTGGPSQTTNRAYPSDFLGIQLVQPLFNLMALAQMRQGYAQSDLSDAKFMYNSQDLLVRVLQAYSDVLYAQDDLDYLKAQRDAIKEQQKVNDRRYQLGDGTVTDSLETRASYAMSESRVIDATDTLEVAKRKLEAITGVEIRSAAEVRKLGANFRVLPVAPKAFEVWRDTALSNSSEIRMATHQVEIARQEYEKQKAAHYPTASLVGGWNQQKSQTTVAINQMAETSQVGIQLAIPIFSGGETVGKTSQARANYEKAQAELDRARQTVITELRKQYDLANSSVQKIEALYRAVDSATELTRAMRKSVQGGERVNVDVLLADRGLATARRDLAKAKYDYMLSYLKLKQQAGTLALEDFEKTAKNFQLDSKATVASKQQN